MVAGVGVLREGNFSGEVTVADNVCLVRFHTGVGVGECAVEAMGKFPTGLIYMLTV